MSDANGEFHYELPREAIAQTPVEPRDAARLLVSVGEPDGNAASSRPQTRHRHVRDLPELLQPGDLVVANDTAVLPARLPLRKATGGQAEVLLIEPHSARPISSEQNSPEPRSADARGAEGSGCGSAGWWQALVRPSRRVGAGTELRSERDARLLVTVHSPPQSPPGPPPGVRLVQITYDGQPVGTAAQAAALLTEAADPPLPPYITPQPLTHSTHARRYQTVFATNPGSAAAPTAGLHLTDELISKLRGRDIAWATVTLTVGLDTFRPITGDPDQHVMHSERYEVPEATWQACQQARRVVAVGTTTVRTLETVARTGQLAGRTQLFLRPGEQFKAVDLLLTNFHLPGSTLLMLLAAFVGDRWRDLYDEALRDGYRFLSYGDAMLLSRQHFAGSTERAAVTGQP